MGPHHYDEQRLADRIILTVGKDSGVFLKERPGVFSGHYCFEEARGKAAVLLARFLLSVMFSRHDAKIVVGATPVENRPAAWMSRHLGFKDYGQVDQADVGLVTIFVLTKDEFEKGKE